MSASEFAAWVLAHFDQDVWLTEATLQRRLAGIRGCGLTAAGLLAALLRAGWLTAHPTYPATYCLASKCWWPAEKPKAPARTRCEGSQSIAQS